MKEVERIVNNNNRFAELLSVRSTVGEPWELDARIFDICLGAVNFVIIFYSVARVVDSVRTKREINGGERILLGLGLILLITKVLVGQLIPVLPPTLLGIILGIIIGMIVDRRNHPNSN